MVITTIKNPLPSQRIDRQTAVSKWNKSSPTQTVRCRHIHHGAVCGGELRQRLASRRRLAKQSDRPSGTARKKRCSGCDKSYYCWLRTFYIRSWIMFLELVPFPKGFSRRRLPGDPKNDFGTLVSLAISDVGTTPSTVTVFRQSSRFPGGIQLVLFLFSPCQG